MALTMDVATYGRDAKGRAKLVADLQADLRNAKAAFTGDQLKNIETIVKKYWSGSDAEKFVSELRSKAEEAGKACTKYSNFIESNLKADAQNFESMQASNASIISGK